jgi:radical SAM superfamily enzyme YgiQ (UPF0313 family)
MEILTLKALYKPDFYGFVDDNMMTNKGWLTSFCVYLIDHNIDIIWGCQGRVNHASPAMLDLMYDAGCRFIAYGCESGSQKILDLMNKRITVEQSKQAIINTRKAGIYAHTFWMYGYPGETKKTINETIRFRKEFNIDIPSFFVTPYPETELYRQFEKQIYKEFGSLEDYVCELEEISKPVINLTEFSDTKWLAYKQMLDENREI